MPNNNLPRTKETLDARRAVVARRNALAAARAAKHAAQEGEQPQHVAIFEGSSVTVIANYQRKIMTGDQYRMYLKTGAL